MNVDQAISHEADLKDERFVKNRVECFAVNFGLHLLLLVRHDVDFDVRVRGAAHIHRRQLRGLDHAHCQLQHQTILTAYHTEHYPP